MARRGERPEGGARLQAALTAIAEEAFAVSGVGSWVIARAEGEDLVVVAQAGAPAAVTIGDRLTDEIPVELTAPLYMPGGSFFGELCVVGPMSASDRRRAIGPLARLGRILTALLGAEVVAELAIIDLDALSRRVAQLEREAWTDTVTGLPSRRSWDQALAAEDERCRRHGGDATVIATRVLGLADLVERQGRLAADLHLAATARALRAGLRLPDACGRVASDEFGLLAVHCDRDGADALLDRLNSQVLAEALPLTHAAVTRSEAGDLAAAWATAEGAVSGL